MPGEPRSRPTHPFSFPINTKDVIIIQTRQIISGRSLLFVWKLFLPVWPRVYETRYIISLFGKTSVLYGIGLGEILGGGWARLRNFPYMATHKVSNNLSSLATQVLSESSSQFTGSRYQINWIGIDREDVHPIIIRDKTTLILRIATIRLIFPATSISETLLSNVFLAMKNRILPLLSLFLYWPVWRTTRSGSFATSKTLQVKCDLRHQFFV